MQAGYLTDVDYTGDYYSFLAPGWLAYIAAINGYAAPRLDGPIAWCELGCGKGLSALLLAATHPSGDFHACDINPSHIDYAERLRRASGVGNLTLHSTSFRDLLAEALPPFDFVVLHGVYSWVPDTVRAEIREFLARRLKPGGLCMVSYNAMPGWAHLQPLRHMMKTFADAARGDTFERARAAFVRLQFLAEHGATYFRTLPAAADYLKTIADKDIRYVAHEYLTPHGDPFYFTEVAGAMEAAGLAFAGSMFPADNYAELAVPEPFRELLPESRGARETHRDFIANTSFRRDLYAAQPRSDQPVDLPLERFAGLSFCLAGLPEELPLVCTQGSVQFDLRDQAETVAGVHRLLEQGPSAVDDIHGASGMGRREDTSFLLQQLVVAGHVVPCPPACVLERCIKANAALVDAGMREHWQQVPLACANTGLARPVEVINAAAIDAAARYAAADEGAESVLRQLRRHTHPVNRFADGETDRPATDEEVRQYVMAAWRRLRDLASSDGRLVRQLGMLP